MAVRSHAVDRCRQPVESCWTIGRVYKGHLVGRWQIIRRRSRSISSDFGHVLPTHRFFDKLRMTVGGAQDNGRQTRPRHLDRLVKTSALGRGLLTCALAGSSHSRDNGVSYQQLHYRKESCERDGTTSETIWSDRR